MIISILTDNYPGRNTRAEHGLSYLIEYDGNKILFDTGQSDLFLLNASVMGLDMTDIDWTVLSHGHFDHGNGLDYLAGGKLLCHPACFNKRYRNADHSYIGLKSSRLELCSKFNLITSKVPYMISSKIIFLGEIPRRNNFESQSTMFSLEDGSPDFVSDDSAIVCRMNEGLFVITGCGHSGIVNTLEYAKEVAGDNRLYGILGGFHLKRRDHQLAETIHYLKQNNISKIFPSHCTAFDALTGFAESFSIRLLKTGEQLFI